MSTLRCPSCGDRGSVGADLVCRACHTPLEYAAPGRLRVRSEALDCPRCSGQSPVGQACCEHCGRRLQKICPLCHQLHPLGTPVCLRLGEPLPRPRWRRPLTWAAALLVAAGLAAQGALGEPSPPLPPPPVVGVNRPHLDVVFVVDSTGSMADEIEVVKTKIRAMIARVQSGQPRPVVRVGLVTYRDHGDEYVTRSWPLTEDLNAIEKALASLEADGGGDTPEAVSEAVEAAVADMNWGEPNQKRGRLLFLIGDAGPHAGSEGWRQYAALARDKGIRVHTWGCSGIMDSGEAEFREIAQITGGQFECLTYRQQVVRPDGSTGYVLLQGSDVYETEEAGEAWKAGASVLAGSGRARKSEASLAPVGAYHATPLATASGELENNLDEVLTRQLMEEARAQGTRY